MDNKKNLPDSKRFLVVYVFGLFSVALVLILLSFVSQSRADQELLTLTEKLSATESALLEKDQAVTGAQGRLDNLQTRIEEQDLLLQEQQVFLESMSTVLGIDFTIQNTIAEVNQAIATYEEQQVLYNTNATAAALLGQMAYALVTENVEDAHNTYNLFVQAYGEDGANAHLTELQTQMFTTYQQQILFPAPTE